MRQTVHVVIGIAFWALFVLLWGALWYQHKASGDALLDSFTRVGMCAGIVLGLTLWWVSHNVAIYRRKGPRTGRPANEPDTERDRLGRTVSWGVDGGALGARAAGHVIVAIEGDVKTYADAP